MSDIVVREVVRDAIWTFSCPFTRMGFMPIGGRSTAVKLQNGDLWVLASTPLDEQTKAKLDELGGRVKYLIGPDVEHTIFLPEFKKAYPEAKLIGVDGHQDVPRLKDYKLDGIYGRDAAGTQYGFESEIESCYFSGFINKDVAFNHKSSGTLIQADLLFNLPPKEQYSKSNQTYTIPLVGNLFQWAPSSFAYKKILWGMGRDKQAMRRDAKTVAGWTFDRIIPCHGDVIETGGKQAWTELYKAYLQ